MTIMTNLNQIASMNAGVQIGLIAILIISLIHLIGFFRLRAWLTFSGIGDSANSLEDKYGYKALVLLNLGATMLFLFIPFVYWYSLNSEFISIGYLLTMIFIGRGIGGLYIAIFCTWGTATKSWQILFSSLSLFIGFSLYYGLKLGG